MREKIVDFSLLLIVIATTIYTSINFREKQRKIVLSNLTIEIDGGDSIKFVTESQIREMLNSDTMRGYWLEYDFSALNYIEDILRQNPYVKEAEVYKNISGELIVELVQKRAILRVITPEGIDTYFDEDFNPLEVCDHFVAKVPTISCSSYFLDEMSGENSSKNCSKLDNNRELDSLIYSRKERGLGAVKYYTQKREKDFDKIKKIYTFVDKLEMDSFWGGMVVQYNITNDQKLEIVPRVGSHSVVVCSLNNLDSTKSRIEKLKGFYQEILQQEGFEYYKKIDLRFDKLVVASN